MLFFNWDRLGPDLKARLDAFLESNHSLFVMYSMKEQLCLFQNLENAESADYFLQTWCMDARNRKSSN